MLLSEVNRLLDPSPMPLEMGYERLPNGALHIACRTDLHRCTGEMFEWWFRFRPNTQQYIWWHPVDHVSSQWIEVTEGTHIGSIHKVEEYFSGQPMAQLLIQFRDPTEFFDAEQYALARSEKRITAAICGRTGRSWDALRDDQGRMLGSRLLHIGRDTEWGCVLRSHFYLGNDLPAKGLSPEEVTAAVPEIAGQALLQHCYNEFTYLSRFLPSLFIAENRNTHKVKVPW
jgi:DAPG hydrolase PhiG domain